jgi:hypothetical protein
VLIEWLKHVLMHLRTLPGHQVHEQKKAFVDFHSDRKHVLCFWSKRHQGHQKRGHKKAIINIRSCQKQVLLHLIILPGYQNMVLKR